MSDELSRWDVLDWRRRTAGLYRAVRREPDPAQGHRAWVTGRDAMLTAHPASPMPRAVRGRFPGADVAPYDPAYRFTVPVAAARPQVREVRTGTDGLVRFELLGRITLGDLGTLDVWWLTGYGGGLFLPLRDATSGVTSYGGGRYVLDTVKGADLGGGPDGLVVDLNFAYQPSCAYDPAWACPLPGAGSTVTGAVPVGERYRPVE